MSAAAANAPDAVLLIAFGGPTNLDEVPAFVTNVLQERRLSLDEEVPSRGSRRTTSAEGTTPRALLRCSAAPKERRRAPARRLSLDEEATPRALARRLPPERMAEIVERYRLIGGRSPINEVTFRLAERLAGALRQGGAPLPVYVGMRDWSPSLEETLRRMASDGIRRALGIILAPHQAEESWGRYQAAVAAARQRIGSSAPEIAYAPAWFDHPDFIEAVVALVRAALDRVPPSERPQTRLIFTAHSIPVASVASSPYVQQIARSAELAAARCDGVPWMIAYQSRSQFSTQPWLEPDLYDVIRAEAGRGTRTLIVTPIGFVCDHLEVLYDLDIAAQAIADEVGVRLLRAATVADHPAFLRMLASLVTALQLSRTT